MEIKKEIEVVALYDEEPPDCRCCKGPHVYSIHPKGKDKISIFSEVVHEFMNDLEEKGFQSKDINGKKITITFNMEE